MLAAPLLISLDLRTIRPEFKQMLQVFFTVKMVVTIFSNIFQHPGVLKVSQDPLGKPGFRVARLTDSTTTITY